MEKTIPIALPRFFHASGDHAVLLIHGFASYPGVMDYLAGRIRDSGISVFVPRLPGHGTNGEDFTGTRAGEWYRSVADSYLDLRGKYSRVFVAGLSLGGILSVLLAARYTPDGIILLAPAILNTNRLILLTPILRHFVKRLPGPWEAQGQDMDNPEILYLAEEYWKWRWTGPAAEVLALQRQARRVLKRVTAPTLLIVSEADATVPVDVVPFIERRISSKEVATVVLERSKHTLVTDVEKNAVAREVIKQLKSWTMQHSEGDSVIEAPSQPNRGAT